MCFNEKMPTIKTLNLDQNILKFKKCVSPGFSLSEDFQRTNDISNETLSRKYVKALKA